MSEKRVKFGLENVHYALYIPGVNGAAGTYETPKPIPGAVSFSPTAQGNDYTFYADNKPFFTYTKDNGDAGDMEASEFPDEFLIDTLGWIMDDNGALIELAGQPQKPFALLFEVGGVTDGKDDPIRVVYYHTTGAKPTTSYSTSNEGVQVQTSKMTLKAAPIEVLAGKSMTRISLRKSKGGTKFEGFFESVYIPQVTTL